MKLLMFLYLFVSIPLVFGNSIISKTNFLPENKLRIPVGLKGAGGLSEGQFNTVIDKVETIYAPVFSRMGGKMKINRKWTDETVNASAERSGTTWTLNMYGGLARHNTITEEGFSLVLCHEIGHHIGGAPKIANVFQSEKWATNEGQADYWATLKCLRAVFLNDNNRMIAKKLNAPATLNTACAKAHPNKDDEAICIRAGMAGASVAGLFAVLSNGPAPKFDTPDSKVVTRTNDSHPAYQCRLDTFFQGALCEIAFTEDVSQNEEVKGTCHGSTGQTVGLRPRCWFKPSK